MIGNIYKPQLVTYLYMPNHIAVM